MDITQISRDAAQQLVMHNNYQFLGGKTLSDEKLECLVVLTANWFGLAISELWSIYELNEICLPVSCSGFKAWLQDPKSLGMWASRRSLANAHLTAYIGSFDVNSCNHLIEFRLVRLELMGESLQMISENI
ncbi:hypothetical protein OTK49_03520 [Vibrio coralliirubri]|uniref:hypothetical protein n=1 Tax=Vibrio coralliirubri TaxID=1516159 RepID=UPI0022837AC9|nr:hypothetical protein [Vibrio coralliirubri]MCY9861587.1 hypothetical protein [Vibrio coralliirubri]